jgi:hypothetical protein
MIPERASFARQFVTPLKRAQQPSRDIKRQRNMHAAQRAA